MSSMIHKVKDALKPGHEHGHDSYNQTTASGAHGHSTMPGAFDGTSKYGAEPSQSSYAHDQTRTHHGVGSGITGPSTGAGARTSALHSRDGQSANTVPDQFVMDPADSGHSANVMDRTKGDYTHGTTDSGHNVLHKRDDARTNYDNSGRAARDDQAAVLRQQQAGEPVHNSNLANKLDPRVDSTRHPDVNTTTSTTTSTTGYGQTDRTSRDPTHNSNVMNKLDPRVDSTRQADYGNTTSSTGYAQTNRTSREPVHNSNIANKLDPRVDSTRQPDYNTSTSTTGYGQSNTTSGYDRSDKDSRDPPVHNSNLLNKLDPRVDSTKTTDHDNNRDSYGTTDRKPTLPARPRDDHNTSSGNYSSRNPDPYHSSNTTTSHSGVPYSMTGAHTSGHDAGAAIGGMIRSHFHCMSCGHKNDVSHLSDARGGKISGRTMFHCMDCGHRNEVGHLFK